MNKHQYDAFVKKLLGMLEDIASPYRYNFKKLDFSAPDLSLETRSTHSLIASVIFKAFKPATYQYRHQINSYNIIDFNVQEVDPGNSILTDEGMEAAHHKMFEILKGYVIDEEDRLSTCIHNLLAESDDIDEIKIRQAINSKVDELEQLFETSDSYKKKNAILVRMSELYNTLRNVDELKQLVLQHLNPTVKVESEVAHSEESSTPQVTKYAILKIIEGYNSNTWYGKFLSIFGFKHKSQTIQTIENYLKNITEDQKISLQDLENEIASTKNADGRKQHRIDLFHGSEGDGSGTDKTIEDIKTLYNPKK